MLTTRADTLQLQSRANVSENSPPKPPPMSRGRGHPAIIEFKCVALDPVRNAIFGTKSRIKWYVSPNEDERVSSLVSWIKIMSDMLGGCGVSVKSHNKWNGELTTLSAPQVSSKWTTRCFVHKRQLLLQRKPRTTGLRLGCLESPSANERQVH